MGLSNRFNNELIRHFIIFTRRVSLPSAHASVFIRIFPADVFYIQIKR